MKNYQLLRSVLELINLCENMEEVRELTQHLLSETSEFVSAPANRYPVESQTNTSTDTLHRFAV